MAAVLADGTTMGEASADDAPVDETTVDGTTATDAPVDDDPVDDAPVDDASTDETDSKSGDTTDEPKITPGAEAKTSASFDKDNKRILIKLSKNPQPDSDCTHTISEILSANPLIKSPKCTLYQTGPEDNPSVRILIDDHSDHMYIDIKAKSACLLSVTPYMSNDSSEFTLRKLLFNNSSRSSIKDLTGGGNKSTSHSKRVHGKRAHGKRVHGKLRRNTLKHSKILTKKKRGAVKNKKLKKIRRHTQKN